MCLTLRKGAPVSIPAGDTRPDRGSLPIGISSGGAAPQEVRCPLCKTANVAGIGNTHCVCRTCGEEFAITSTTYVR